MRWVVTIGIAVGLAGPIAAQKEPESNTSVLLGPSNMDLAIGSVAMQAGDYDTGIERTLAGLEDRSLNSQDRSSALSNLCAAYAAKQLPDTAIRYCTEALTHNDLNWRAFSNRSYAYWLMGRYAEAQEDLDTASGINPQARQIAQIRGMINERTLQPNIVMEDLQ
jgi:tetratricopeptide (TPR) repeat protein